MSGIDIGVVNVGIAGQHIRSSIHHGSITRTSKEDEVSIEDVNRLRKICTALLFLRAARSFT
jgi:cell division protein FtsA